MTKTCPEVLAMRSKPPAYLPGTRTWNPAYGKWYYWKNRETQLQNAKKWRENKKAQKRKQDREYRLKNLGKLRRQDRLKYANNPKCRKRKKDAARKYYKEHTEIIKKRRRDYHKKMRSDPKYVRRRRMIDAKIRSLTAKTKKGFVYFFRSVTPGFYKVGCTENWKERKKTYKGANSIDRLFFVRPVKKPFFAETMMKIFLEGIGYTKFNHESNKKLGDWFVKKDEMVFTLTSGTLSSKSRKENASE